MTDGFSDLIRAAEDMERAAQILAQSADTLCEFLAAQRANPLPGGPRKETR